MHEAQTQTDAEQEEEWLLNLLQQIHWSKEHDEGEEDAEKEEEEKLKRRTSR